MSRSDSSAGGSAMQGGASYQNQAAAWLATKMLSEGSSDPIGPRGKVVYLAAETGAAVDDLLVGTESDSYGFIQAKRRLSLSNLPNSPLADTINQAVRQLASPPESGRRPWSRALDPALDRVVLVTSSTSGAPVLERPELVLILRPSFHMRLQRLWMTNRDAFWDLTLKLCSTEGLSSLVQSCPLVVVAENARTQEDVALLADQLAANASLQLPGVGRAYHHLVGVLISGGRESRPDLGESAGPWISLAMAAAVPDEISQMIDAQLWLDSAKTAWEDRTSEQHLQLGLVARRLLEAAWAEADRNDLWVVAAIRNVGKTFASDAAASAALLRQALNPEHVKVYGHQELKWIAESASELAGIDPGFVADLYIAAFSWRETAEDSTYLFKSRINGFRSNRRQDYEHARWDLARRFPRLLSADPGRATTALIQMAEVYSRNEHQGSTEIEKFDLNGVATGIRTDYASIWDSGGHADENASAILNTYFRDLNERAAIEAAAPS